MPKSTGLYISDELFDQIAEVAKSEDRSWNQTAMRLLKRGLAPQPAADARADLVTALQEIIAECPNPRGGYGVRINEIARAALAPFLEVTGE